MHFRSLFWRAVVRSEDRLGDPAGYIRNQMGDEMSKHKKFFFLTWIGQEVGVIQRVLEGLLGGHLCPIDRD